MSEDELSKAIIGTIGDIDAYQLPGLGRMPASAAARGQLIAADPLDSSTRNRTFAVLCDLCSPAFPACRQVGCS